MPKHDLSDLELTRRILLVALAVFATQCKAKEKAEPVRQGASETISDDAGADAGPDAGATTAMGIARLAMAGASSDSNRWQREPDKRLKSKDPIEVDPSFVFELGTGNARDGLDLTGFGAGGRAHHIWRVTDGDPAGWRMAQFQVTEAELGALVKRLNDIDFFGQPQETVDPAAHDGVVWIVFVRTRGREKYVYLSNALPEAFLGLGRFVVDLVNKRAELEQRSSRFSVGPFHDRHLWRGWEDYTQKRPRPDPGICLVSDAEPEKLKGLRFSGALVDQTKKKKLAKISEVANKDGSLPCIPYRRSRIDESHDYVLELEVDYPKQKKPVALEPLPVVTRGAPFVAFVPARSD